MPRIDKAFTLEVSPERFLEACSPEELRETFLLLNTERFRQRMAADSQPCESSDWGCVYHACMSDDCQRPGMMKRKECRHLGPGNCETKKIE